MLKLNKNKLYCFSPEVMIITFILEILMALYSLFKSIKHRSDLGVVVILVFLAMFQLAEYQICAGGTILTWAKIGFFFITFLPITGLYLLSRLSKEARMLKVGVAISIIFAAIFTFIPGSINNATCGGNYVMFGLNSYLSSIYGYYYFGFLLWGIWQATGALNKTEQPHIRKALGWFIAGYLSFILPLTIVYILYPTTDLSGVPSIMCGFAVIFAFVLTFIIGPIYHRTVKHDK